MRQMRFFGSNSGICVATKNKTFVGVDAQLEHVDVGVVSV
jgi:hypothetical protein